MNKASWIIFSGMNSKNPGVSKPSAIAKIAVGSYQTSAAHAMQSVVGVVVSSCSQVRRV